ncbi:MAG: 50S ribosomal protein L20 [Patescibacteria group bacterium]
MARVKRGMLHAKKRRNLLAHTKGFMNKRNTKLRLARVAFLKAGVNAYKSRRLKKRGARQVWSIRINAAAREEGTTYSKLINALKVAGIELDRKILSTIAAEQPQVFKAIVSATK